MALLTRIYEAFALVCPLHGGNMRLIAFITEGVQISRILEHIDVDTQAKGRMIVSSGPNEAQCLCRR